MKKMESGSDILFIFLAGIYIISRPLIETPVITDIAVGACLILTAIKQYILNKRGN